MINYKEELDHWVLTIIYNDAIGLHYNTIDKPKREDGFFVFQEIDYRTYYINEKNIRSISCIPVLKEKDK